MKGINPKRKREVQSDLFQQEVSVAHPDQKELTGIVETFLTSATKNMEVEAGNFSYVVDTRKPRASQPAFEQITFGADAESKASIQNLRTALNVYFPPTVGTQTTLYMNRYREFSLVLTLTETQFNSSRTTFLQQQQASSSTPKAGGSSS